MLASRRRFLSFEQHRRPHQELCSIGFRDLYCEPPVKILSHATRHASIQGDNLEVSLSPLPMRGGEGEGEQARTPCERWQDLGQVRGNTVESVYLLVESRSVLKVFVGCLWAPSPSPRKE